MWTWANDDRSSVIRIENGITHSRSIDDPDLMDWLNAGNVPNDPPQGTVRQSDPRLPDIGFTHVIDGMRITLYLFPESGRMLPMHDHAFAHNSVLLKGSILVRRGDGSQEIMNAPMQSTLFPAAEPHELIAMEAGSACLQIQLD